MELDSSYVREEKFFARVTAALMQPRQVNLLVLKKFAAYMRILTPCKQLAVSRSNIFANSFLWLARRCYGLVSLLWLVVDATASVAAMVAVAAIACSRCSIL